MLAYQDIGIDLKCPSKHKNDFWKGCRIQWYNLWWWSIMT